MPFVILAFLFVAIWFIIVFPIVLISAFFPPYGKFRKFAFYVALIWFLDEASQKDFLNSH